MALNAFVVLPDNDPKNPPVIAAMSNARLLGSATVGSNHTVMAAMSNTLHGTGEVKHNVGA
jgi:hypothetical protein